MCNVHPTTNVQIHLSATFIGTPVTLLNVQEWLVSAYVHLIFQYLYTLTTTYYYNVSFVIFLSHREQCLTAQACEMKWRCSLNSVCSVTVQHQKEHLQGYAVETKQLQWICLYNLVLRFM